VRHEGRGAGDAAVKAHLALCPQRDLAVLLRRHLTGALGHVTAASTVLQLQRVRHARVHSVIDLPVVGVLFAPCLLVLIRPPRPGGQVVEVPSPRVAPIALGGARRRLRHRGLHRARVRSRARPLLGERLLEVVRDAEQVGRVDGPCLRRGLLLDQIVDELDASEPAREGSRRLKGVQRDREVEMPEEK